MYKRKTAEKYKESYAVETVGQKEKRQTQMYLELRHWKINFWKKSTTRSLAKQTNMATENRLLPLTLTAGTIGRSLICIPTICVQIDIFIMYHSNAFCKRGIAFWFFSFLIRVFHMVWTVKCLFSDCVILWFKMASSRRRSYKNLPDKLYYIQGGSLT